MEVEIVSRETIKPSSQTPHHLKIQKLSYLDQLSPLTYTPLIFFYPMDNNKTTNSHFKLQDQTTKLKQSLSETLTNFNLLAGKIKGNSFIDCNDDGALFSEAKVSGITISGFLKHPNINILHQLLPCSFLCTEPMELSVQVAIQLNVFSCGGIAIAVCLLHKVIDGTTLSVFLKSWAAVNRGLREEVVCAEDYKVVSSLFPQRESTGTDSWLTRESPFVDTRGKSCTRRFVFDAAAILSLKAKAKDKINSPTCVEVVTAFIWKHLMKAATRVRSCNSQRSSVLSHAVNLRRRMDPPLPNSFVGNLFWSALAHYNHDTDSSINTDHEDQTDFGNLVSVVRQSFAEVDTNYVQKMVGEGGFETISKSLLDTQEIHSKIPFSYGFSSWRNMGLNEVDFGWGKPVWVSSAGSAGTSVVTNVGILMETRFGDGVEAWVILDKEEMEIIERDLEFIEFGSPNPPIPLD